MKITFTGRQVELAPAQLKKLESRFAKIGKLLVIRSFDPYYFSRCATS